MAPGGCTSLHNKMTDSGCNKQRTIFDRNSQLGVADMFLVTFWLQAILLVTFLLKYIKIHFVTTSFALAYVLLTGGKAIWSHVIKSLLPTIDCDIG